MAKPREPIELIIAKGKKNLTKGEIAERRASEVAPCADDLSPPSYLTAKQKAHFKKLAGQLNKIKIMGETDTETLARYVTAQSLYEQAVKEQRALHKGRPKPTDSDYYVKLDLWYKADESAAKLIDRYFKQAMAAARELGLTISSRCRLQVPVKEEVPKDNKFAKFGGTA